MNVSLCELRGAGLQLPAADGFRAVGSGAAVPLRHVAKLDYERLSCRWYFPVFPRIMITLLQVGG